MNQLETSPKPTRRRFLSTSAGLVLAGMGTGRASAAPQAPAIGKTTRPNFLIIVTDQLGLDAISAHGCRDAHTPNIDRLVERGVTFMESHSTNPVCSPARSSMFTGCMPVETGVVSNNRPINRNVPNMGQWVGERGYEPFYCGKWHIPGGYPLHIEGFNVLPSGGGQGDITDTQVSRITEAFLRNRRSERPFVFVSSLLQPHDICYWALQAKELVPQTLPFEHLASQLPELPPNFDKRPKAPEAMERLIFDKYTPEQWRYYLYIYYRQVEMVDADVGRILRALDESGLADDTIVMFTSDHGDGRARHQHAQKWYPYDEAMKVPLIVSCPARMESNARDPKHLVSGIDLVATLCDYARMDAPGGITGTSLRPLLEGTPTEWREYLGAEYRFNGRIIRTDQFKYAHFEGDPVEQLFDMQADPWETTNLYEDAHYADVLAAHRTLLDEWNGRMNVVPPSPEARYG